MINLNSDAIHDAPTDDGALVYPTLHVVRRSFAFRNESTHNEIYLYIHITISEEKRSIQEY